MSRRALFPLLFVAALPGCAAFQNSGPSANGRAPVPQAEIQEDLERFYGDSIALFTDAARPLVGGAPPDVRDTVLRRLLVYESSALDITTGPTPVINLLDMVVFVELTRAVFERHWIHVLGDQGEPMLAALKDSKQRISRVASKVMTADQQRELESLIARWLAENPKQVNVEGVRFAAFSDLAGKLSRHEQEEAAGLFASVTSATQSADTAVLAAERLRFLATRYPYVLRLHARLGASEVTGDAVERLDEVEQSLSDARPFVHDATGLASELKLTMREGRALLDALAPVLERFPPGDSAQSGGVPGEGTDKSGGILEGLDRANDVLAQLNALVARDPGAVATVRTAEHAIDGMMKKAALYLVLVGAAWALFFWAARTLSGSPERRSRLDRRARLEARLANVSAQRDRTRRPQHAAASR